MSVEALLQFGLSVEAPMEMFYKKKECAAHLKSIPMVIVQPTETLYIPFGYVAIPTIVNKDPVDKKKDKEDFGLGIFAIRYVFDTAHEHVSDEIRSDIRLTLEKIARKRKHNKLWKDQHSQSWRNTCVHGDSSILSTLRAWAKICVDMRWTPQFFRRQNQTQMPLLDFPRPNVATKQQGCMPPLCVYLCLLCVCMQGPQKSILAYLKTVPMADKDDD